MYSMVTIVNNTVLYILKLRGMLTKPSVAIISQYIHIPNHYIAHQKQCYMLIKYQLKNLKRYCLYQPEPCQSFIINKIIQVDTVCPEVVFGFFFFFLVIKYLSLFRFKNHQAGERIIYLTAYAGPFNRVGLRIV